ncbi:Leucine Rich Repeat [Seminavis robusta]|uniref:Leucine Rich Repeat n=1 Tax=Seminavis robusta TaxID=568900 RepID=A0A9N8E9P6_9STRA|nr:Leucine Rich Repeat [Seminavis robusta]|eukprot:Sro701_g189760.1 Leucine Rich Repeat (1255) ;mRNA; f:15396-19160
MNDPLLPSASATNGRDEFPPPPTSSSSRNLMQDETMVARTSMTSSSSSSAPALEQSAGLSSSPDDELQNNNSIKTLRHSNRSLTTGSYSFDNVVNASTSAADDDQVQRVHLNVNNTYDDSFFEPADEEVVFISSSSSTTTEELEELSNELEDEEEYIVQDGHQDLQDEHSQDNDGFDDDDDGEDHDELNVAFHHDDEDHDRLLDAKEPPQQQSEDNNGDDDELESYNQALQADNASKEMRMEDHSETENEEDANQMIETIQNTLNQQQQHQQTGTRDSAVFTTEDDYEEREEPPRSVASSQQEEEDDNSQASPMEHDDDDDRLEYPNVSYQQTVGQLVLADHGLLFFQWEETKLSIPWDQIAKRQVSPPNFHIPMLRVKTTDDENYMFRLPDAQMAETLREDLKLFPNYNRRRSSSVAQSQQSQQQQREAPQPLHYDYYDDDDDETEESSSEIPTTTHTAPAGPSVHSFYHDAEDISSLHPPDETVPLQTGRRRADVYGNSFHSDDHSDEDTFEDDNDVETARKSARRELEREHSKRLDQQQRDDRPFWGGIFFACCWSAVIFLAVGVVGGYFWGKSQGGESDISMTNAPVVSPVPILAPVTLPPSPAPVVVVEQPIKLPWEPDVVEVPVTPSPSSTVSTLAPTKRGLPPKETSQPTAVPTTLLTPTTDAAPTTLVPTKRGLPPRETNQPTSFPTAESAPVSLAPTKRGLPPRETDPPTVGPTTAADNFTPTISNSEESTPEPTTTTSDAGASTTPGPTAAETGQPSVNNNDAEGTMQPTLTSENTQMPQPTAGTPEPSGTETLAPTLATNDTLVPTAALDVGTPTVANDQTLQPSVAASTNSPTTSDTTAATTELPTASSPVLDTLRGASSDGGAAMDTPGTPQNLASQWLLNEDTLAAGLPQAKQLQRYGLATLFYSTGGDAAWDAPQQRQATSSTNSWLNVDSDDCTWSYIVCDSNLEIVALEFLPPAPTLVGSIPPEIGLLTSLTQFVIGTGDAEQSATARRAVQLHKAQMESRVGVVLKQSNGAESVNAGMLSGPVPSEIGNLKLLESFQVANQAISSTLPNQVGDMSSLVTLDLSNNQISGTIPVTTGTLGQLKELRLGYNMLEGGLESGLFNEPGGLLTSLTGLFLNNNMIVGTLTTYLGLLTNIETGLQLQANALEGTLPTELAQLTEIKVFRVDSNKLSGQIPSDLRAWSQIEEFQVQDNLFSGDMPREICRAFSVIGTNAYANCDELSCTCCKFCCSNGECAES